MLGQCHRQTPIRHQVGRRVGTKVEGVLHPPRDFKLEGLLRKVAADGGRIAECWQDHLIRMQPVRCR